MSKSGFVIVKKKKKVRKKEKEKIGFIVERKKFISMSCRCVGGREVTVKKNEVRKYLLGKICCRFKKTND